MNIHRTLKASNFQELLNALTREGYRILGPTLRDGAIILDQVRSVSELPRNVYDEHFPGAYRLRERSNRALFAFSIGPDSWKKYLHPSQTLLWRAIRDNGNIQFHEAHPSIEKLAFLGVRACDLQAIAVQRKVFQNYVPYQERLDNTFIIAVNCTEPASTCFCASMHTGPKAKAGFDLALTEICDSNRHEFLVEVGSDEGGELLSLIATQETDSTITSRAEDLFKAAASRMARSIHTEGLTERMYTNPEHPEWEKVSLRCLSCGNCTTVCPTCFCTTWEDSVSLDGSIAERCQKWDSCFNAGFSYIHGGSIRQSVTSRYRQWVLHKMATWNDQFSTSGCVGCGRCITWCPAGIDITQVVGAIAQNETNQHFDEEEIDL